MADRKSLALFYDSASGSGCTYRVRRLGVFGKAEIFSFHATKVFTMEGGALTTNVPALFGRACQLRGFGQIGDVDCGRAGPNGKMMEVSALVGLRALDTFDEVLAHRAWIEAEYERLLAAIPGVRLQGVVPGNTSSRLYEALLLDEKRFGLGSIGRGPAAREHQMHAICGAVDALQKHANAVRARLARRG